MPDEIAAAAPVEAPAPVSAPEAPATEAAEPAATSPGEKLDSLDGRLLEIYNKHNPVRSGDGKFAAREPQEPVSDQPQPETVERAATPSIDPPTAWSADKKAIWPTLPPAAQTYIAQREGESHQAITRMGEELAQLRPFGELLTTHRDTFSRHGVDPQAGIAALLDAQQRLDADPRGALAAIAQMYGVDLAELAGLQHQQQGPVDPTVSALQQKLDRLERSQAERDRRDQDAAKAQEAALQTKVKDDLGKWAQGKPHFEEVRELMGTLFASGKVNTLDEAYDMACNALPSVRAKVTEQARKDAEAKRLADQAKQVSEAKRAAPLNTGTRRASPAKPAAKWDDDGYLTDLHGRVAKAG